MLNPTFSGTVGGLSKAMVGLGNVDNTSDANKPTTTAVTNLLATKQNTIVTTEAGNVCTSLGNKQRLVSTTDAKLKVQRFDDDGTFATDS